MNRSAIPLVIIPVVLLCSGLFFLTGLGNVISATGAAFVFCQSIFVRCLAYSHFIKLFVLWAGAAIVAIGLVYAAAKAIYNLITSRRAVKRLPVKDTGGPVVLITDNNCKTAFTYGLFHPRIYISKGFIETMDASELKSVFLHELHHKKSKDPLKFFLLTVLKDMFFYLPMVKELADRARFNKECTADLSAVRSMKEPYSLASAIIKAARFGNAAFSASSGLTDSGAEERVRRLVGDSTATAPLVSAKAVALSVAGIIFVLFSLSAPVYAYKPEKCTTKHCEKHVNILGKDCKTHCETTAHTPHNHN